MRTIDQIDDYFKQLGAYALAHDEIYGTKIEMGVIFMVSRNNDFRILKSIRPTRNRKRKFITAQSLLCWQALFLIFRNILFRILMKSRLALI